MVLGLEEAARWSCQGRISFLPLMWSLWEPEVHLAGNQGRAVHLQNTRWHWHPLHPSHLFMVQDPTPKPWDRDTLINSNWGVTPCSSSLPEKCWRGQVWDQDRSAASWHSSEAETLPRWAEQHPELSGVPAS